MARTPAPTIVLTKLITDDIHDADPPMPLALRCNLLRRELDDVEAGREPCSLSTELIAAYEAIMKLVVCRKSSSRESMLIVLVFSGYRCIIGHESNTRYRLVRERGYGDKYSCLGLQLGGFVSYATLCCDADLGLTSKRTLVMMSRNGSRKISSRSAQAGARVFPGPCRSVVCVCGSWLTVLKTSHCACFSGTTTCTSLLPTIIQTNV